jgi:hypothetical protein
MIHYIHMGNYAICSWKIYESYTHTQIVGEIRKKLRN